MINVQLRNLGIQLQQIIDSIVPFINEEKDVLYQRGFNKGEAEGGARANPRVVKNVADSRAGSEYCGRLY